MAPGFIANFDCAMTKILRPRRMPGMVGDAMAGKIQLEPFVTHTMGLKDINEAFDLMHEGKSIRSVVKYAA